MKFKKVVDSDETTLLQTSRLIFHAMSQSQTFFSPDPHDLEQYVRQALDSRELPIGLEAKIQRYAARPFLLRRESMMLAILNDALLSGFIHRTQFR